MNELSGFADENMADENMAALRCNVMYDLMAGLTRSKLALDRLSRAGYRSEKERKALEAMRPLINKVHGEVAKLHGEHNRSRQLKKAYDVGGMNVIQQLVCEVLLSEELPCNAYFKYVMDPDEKRSGKRGQNGCRPPGFCVPKTVDFALPDRRIAIFADPKPWSRKGESQEDKFLALCGWTVFRFSNIDLANSTDPRAEVRRVIRSLLK